MPELPEVETICCFLRAKIEGWRIESVRVFSPQLRYPIPELTHIQGQCVAGVERNARYISLCLEDGSRLTIHLGMSGRLTLNPSQFKKHDHLALGFLPDKNSGGKRATIVLNDPRRFGMVYLLTPENHKRLVERLGIEPLGPNLTVATMQEQFGNKTQNIKTSLMGRIAGVGNIYANEILFDAFISPLRPAASLTRKDLGRLKTSIAKILNLAISLGGSSIRDYQTPESSPGYFQMQFKVYQKADKPCYCCGASIIRIKQNGRSTFFCERCQQ